MEFFSFPPIIFEYFIDNIDNTLYNYTSNNILLPSLSSLSSLSSSSSSLSSSSFPFPFQNIQIFSSNNVNIIKNSSSSSPPPPSSSPNSPNSSSNSNSFFLTKFSFKFYFNILEEEKSNQFENILLEKQNYFNSILKPIIKYEKLIIERNSSSTSTSSSSSSALKTTLITCTPSFIADSKELRYDNREILMKYDIYLYAIALPLSNYYSLQTLEKLSSQVLINPIILDNLVSNELSNFKSFLLLLLMMAHQLDEIHSEGLCHYHLELNSFILYSPSNYHNNYDNNNENIFQWGVQLMLHWYYFPSGLCDSFNYNHLSNNSNQTTTSKVKLLNIQNDIFYLGGIYIEMTLCWIMRSLLPYKSQLSQNILNLLTYTKFQLIHRDCISINKCTTEFETLLQLTFSILYPNQPSKQIIEQFITLCNYVIHVDEFERYDCFYIEEILREIIDLFDD